jgi:hypothetical protein
MCVYCVGDPGCKKASAPILVNVITLKLLIKITSLQANKLDEKRQGDKLHRKGKRGRCLSPREYFINIFEKYNLCIFIYPKFLRDENESPSG